MTDQVDTTQKQTVPRFCFSQLTRSSGRVRGLAQDYRSRQAATFFRTDAPSELVKIYHRFLDLQDEESGDLSAAISYGLRLFAKGASKASTPEAELQGHH